MSNSVFGKSRALTIDESDSSVSSPRQRQRSDSAASESSLEMDIRNKRPSLTASISRVNSQRRPPRSPRPPPRLRRKDLEIEENATVLIAVKEPTHDLPTPSASSISSADQTKDVFEEPKDSNHLSVENGNNRWLDYTANRKPSLINCNGKEEPLEEKAVRSTLSLSLQMKLKISDKPVKAMSMTNYNGEPMVVTGAGNYGDEEALLRWRRDANSGLWINDPLVDCQVTGSKRTLLSSNGGSVKRKVTTAK
ncbi:hypothetical protein M3Y97_00207000 [Aphelenchoides bicaudatus]|nr:hypothetical protein M3Y97_00207000 [Aphelenchoides bicaudatus]